jgi:hypothetical protein
MYTKNIQGKVNFLSRPKKGRIGRYSTGIGIGFMNTSSGYLVHRTMWLDFELAFPLLLFQNRMDISIH